MFAFLKQLKAPTHQDASIHVAIAAAQVHANPDDAGVGPLMVIHRQGVHGNGAFVMGGQSRCRVQNCRAEICAAVRGGAEGRGRL